ncbi:phage antirepressor KilAC domain-containing protein [Galactobacillus timonensis]|uniref:phage antirepressor KilAC domain-containing protein n=1 Tax=Galactobacillus timonensis TaxID=2041840 RepID=UPI000C81FFA2|nr:phage antirepressor KilAC domain-containing protein [Galactobacillus timonensis]
MNDITPIKISSNSDRVTVSARELHDALQIQTDYPHWFGRMTEYGFVEGEDYQTFLSDRSDGLPGKPKQDAEITLEMAKQICMIQRTDIGRQYREYFLQLEKEWNSPEKVMARALDYAHKTIANLSNQIAEQKPKVIFAEAVSASKTSILIGDLAKILKQNGIDIGQKRLFAWLRDNGYLIKGGASKNMPTQRAMEMGLFVVKEGSYVNGEGVNVTTKTTKVTGKGQIYFINKFKGTEEIENDESSK